MYRKTFVEINSDIIEKNISNIINTYEGYNWYIGVVKGNAYGHGMEIARNMEKAGINYFAVMSLEEALELRQIVSTPILCLEPIDVMDINICIENNITITIYSYNYYLSLKKVKFEHKVKAHIKIDTGMNRLGIKDKDQFVEIYNCCLNNDSIELEGVYTHLGTTGINDKNWDEQVKRFEELIDSVDISKVKIVHAARSTTIINHGKISCTNGVRIGIIMYGCADKTICSDTGLIQKLRNIKRDITRKINKISPTTLGCRADIMPTFKLKSEIVQIKKVQKGECIGYGTLYTADEDMYVATIPVGYADGLPQNSTGRMVEISGKLYKIVGTIGMGMITVKVDDKIKEGELVTVIGGLADIKEIARHTGTTKYAVMTQIAKDIPRIYVKGV